jgi:YVTN family beta-propeller protein
VAIGGSNTVRVIDLDTNTVSASIITGGTPVALAMDATGSRLYVANSTGGSISIVDTSSNTVIATLLVLGQPLAIQLEPSGNFIFVVLASGLPSIPSPGSLQVIDVRNGAVSAGISVNDVASASRFIGGAVPLVSDIPSILTGLWWNPLEPGWGMHLAHRRDVVFASWFTYDAAGAPKWYVASDCRMTAPLVCATCVANTRCTGSLYEVAGPRFFGAAFNPGLAQITIAGPFRMDFADKDNAEVNYTVGSQHGTLAIKRVSFLPAPPAFLVDFTDLWSAPGEAGWGLAITQTQGTLFLAWFVYDDAGRPTWYVASNCVMNVVNNACSGTLYKTAGPPGPSATSAFNPLAVTTTAVGTVSLSFQTISSAFLSFTVNGSSGFKSINRQLF